tara:strand:- start:877 stop:2235 length:1359 start_codon:yes stop_codon:yes gene_type:complete
MRQGKSPLKSVLAACAVLFTIFIWVKGLEDSLNRPSFTPKLSLHQHEIAFMAEPAVPLGLKKNLIGEDPPSDLKKALKDISAKDLSLRDRLLLSSLEVNDSNQKLLLKVPFEERDSLLIKEAILNNQVKNVSSYNDLRKLKLLREDPVLNRAVCLKLVKQSQECDDLSIAKSMYIKLLVSQVFPIFACILGVILILRMFWLFIRKRLKPWPDIKAIPLTIVDMILLIAGGFVVLGEVISPALFIPISDLFTKQLSSPISNSLKVFIGYISMTIPSLVILRQQLIGLDKRNMPTEGWLQWKFVPVPKAFREALQGWLIVLPIVLLVSWAVNALVGDQGGSNPLLELVLGSKNLFALFLLLLTTVVIAPLFEELVFRGALIPVLVKDFGRIGAVCISALVFALAHLSIGELLPLLVLGLGLGFLRLSSGRLFPCVLMHALWNGVTFSSLVLLGG